MTENNDHKDHQHKDHQHKDLGGDPGQHDPKGKRRIALKANVVGSAIFSPCGRYRFVLTRTLKEPRNDKSILWIGTNPSTAEASCDDPTIVREWNFTQAIGFDRYIKMNVSAYRATKQEDLKSAPVPLHVEENTKLMMSEAKNASIIIMAFGILPKPLRDTGFEIARQFLDANPSVAPQMQPITSTIMSLGTTKSGWPRHPLYVLGVTKPKPFDLVQFLTLSSSTLPR